MTSAEGFAAVPNWMIRDSDLSLYAIAVYAALASHSGKGGILPSHPVLAREARCSERKVRDALVELRKAGVVRWEQRKTKKGRGSNLYFLEPNGVPAQDAGTVPAPDAATNRHNLPEPTGTWYRNHPAPGAGEEEPLEEEPLEEETPLPPGGHLALISSTDVEAGPTDDQLFARFWIAYPRKVSKADARRAFIKALANRQHPVRRAFALEIADTAARHATYWRDLEHRPADKIPHPATWINGERWNDELPTAEQLRGRPTNVDHTRSVHEELVRRQQLRTNPQELT